MSDRRSSRGVLAYRSGGAASWCSLRASWRVFPLPCAAPLLCPPPLEFFSCSSPAPRLVLFRSPFSPPSRGRRTEEGGPPQSASLSGGPARSRASRTVRTTWTVRLPAEISVELLQVIPLGRHPLGLRSGGPPQGRSCRPSAPGIPVESICDRQRRWRCAVCRHDPRKRHGHASPPGEARPHVSQAE